VCSLIKKFTSVIFFSFLIANTVALPATPVLAQVFDPRLLPLLKLAPGLDPRALEAALTALKRLQDNGTKVRADVLTVIDYTKPSTVRRLWVFDLAHLRVLFEELTAHGKNSGDNQAVRFSNAPDSLMTSLGAFLTGGTYIGKHGLSLRLEGLEKGINDNSMKRAIVIHAAAYISDVIARNKGRIGRSWGCPAVRPEISRSLIEAVEGGTLVLAYYPDTSWLRNSKLIGPDSSAGATRATLHGG
jgi:L,D-transpeptidase-like protein